MRVAGAVPGILVGLVALTALAPSAARADAFDMPRNREIELGREFAAELERYVRIDTDGALAAKVQRIGRRIVGVCDRQDLPYEFHVIDDKRINAFALPGGYVYIFSGLAQVLPSDDALAFIIGHETAHAAKRHTARQYEKLVKLHVFTLGYADLIGVLLGLHYSRRYEREADYYGTLWTAKAGYRPEGSIEAMETLQKMIGRDKNSFELLRSHPLTEDRIKRLRKQSEMVKEIVREGKPEQPPELPEAPDTGQEELLYPLAVLPLAANPYWPLATGARWTYQTSGEEGDSVKRSVVVAEELPGDIEGVFRLRISYAPQVSADWLETTCASAVFRRLRPESHEADWGLVWITEFPPGESCSADGLTFVPVGHEQVSVPYGTFEALKVEKRTDQDELIATAWFVRDIGPVKIVHHRQGLTEVLQAYQPPAPLVVEAPPSE